MDGKTTGWQNIDRRICEQANEYFSLLVRRGMDLEAARIESDELARVMRESLEHRSAVMDAEASVLNAARRYGAACRDIPLDNGDDARRAREQARHDYLRAALELVRSEGTPIGEE